MVVRLFITHDLVNDFFFQFKTGFISSPSQGLGKCRFSSYCFVTGQKANWIYTQRCDLTFCPKDYHSEKAILGQGMFLVFWESFLVVSSIDKKESGMYANKMRYWREKGMDWRSRRYCGSLDISQVGMDVTLMGWVDAIRDHGSVIFIHLRDVSGIVQVVFDPNRSKDAHLIASGLGQEDVVALKGVLEKRLPGTENPNLSTGELEVFATHLEILSRAAPLPFQISEKAMVYGEELRANPSNVDEDIRLRYRYLDLRRPSRQEFLIKRYQIVKAIRDKMHEWGFIELETPILTKSTPEGARDFLVPSRLHPGRFYALPQSPQLFKQLFMVAGFDRYFQIARCFRDEDLRVNRQPEFTQLDIEASFVEEEFFFDLVEDLLCTCFAINGIHLIRPFPRITYEYAMECYGTDKPDLRYGMEFSEATDIFSCTNYEIFQRIVGNGGTIKGFVLNSLAGVLSKNLLQNEYAQKIVPSLGGKGMTWVKFVDGELQSNIVQFFSTQEQMALLERFGLKDGDVLVMVGDGSREAVNTILGRLRLDFINRLRLPPKAAFAPVWITDFPMFEMTDGGLSAQHHPFTMPSREDFDPKDIRSLLNLKSRAYDIVINGEELGGGSIRIHRPELQQRVFEALGLSSEEIEEKFGFFIKAFQYGAPPHGGIALGLDRMISMIMGTDSIREVIAFPKNRSGVCPMSMAPSPVSPLQLKELKISVEAEAELPGRPDIFQREAPKKAIDRETVVHIAKLARIRIKEEEIDSYAKDLGSILGYVEKLNELDTDSIPPTSHVIEITNVFREDIPRPDFELRAISQASLAPAPDRKDDYFRVPKILEG